MKELKDIVIQDLLEKLNSSPYLIVVEYAGMTVPEFEELRGKLRENSAKLYVTKNSFVKRAAEAAGLPDGLNESLGGQNAVVTGEQDICGAAKVIQDFHKKTEKAAMRSGIMDGKLLTVDEVNALASLPPLPVLQAQFLGVLQAPASKLVRLLNETASALGRILNAKKEQG